MIEGDDLAEGEILPKDTSVPSGSDELALRVDLVQSIRNTTRLSVNVAQDVHITTRDKIELALRKTLPSYVDVSSFLGPLGVFLAVFVGLLTADFKTMFGLDKDVWQAIFVLTALLSLTWTAWNLLRFVRRKKLQDIVQAIIAESSKEDLGHS